MKDMKPPTLALRRISDYASMVKLGKEAGLEIDQLGPVKAAFGLYEGDELVGCACLKEKEGAYLVECLAVAERLRRKGLGSRLVKAVEKEAKEYGATKLLALSRNPEFFESIGYRIAKPGEFEYPTLSSCISCPQFGRSCSPAIVVREI